MRGNDTIHQHPYIPLNCPEDAKKPYICRLSPFENGFEGEYLDNFALESAHTLFLRKRGSGDAYLAIPLSDPTFTVTGLEKEAEYEFFIESGVGEKSHTRLLRTAALPDGAVAINYLHPDDTQYAVSGRFLCSPSLARLPDGTLVAGMDLYGNHMPQNLTLLFSSDDDGKTWRYLNDLYPFYWGSLFTHKGVLYILGLTTEYGNLQIASSKDGGHTWSRPTVLFYGSNLLCKNGGMHRAPMHVFLHEGRLWTTCEYGCWEKGSHLPAVLSIGEDEDLMVASNWALTGFLPFEGAWREASGGVQRDTMEGNIVLTPEGGMREILRWSLGKALVLKVKAPEEPLEFEELRDMPVSSSMFRILPYQGGYIMVTNRKGDHVETEEGLPYRNVLSLFTSKDLKNWTLKEDVVNAEDKDPMKIGFQYPCPLLEGDTLYLNVRSAFNNADNFHNSNTMLFWKLVL